MMKQSKVQIVGLFNILMLFLCSCDSHVVKKTAEIYPYSDNNGMWGYVDSNGEVVIGAKYKLAYHFTNGLAAVLSDSGYNYIKIDGEKLTKRNFEYAKPFVGNFGLVYIKDSLGLERQFIINKGGRLLFENEKNIKINFYDNYGVYVDSDSTYVIDTFGHITNVLKGRAKCIYQGCTGMVRYNDGFYLISENISFSHDSLLSISCFNQGISRIRIGDKISTINGKLELIGSLPNKYRYSSYYSEGKMTYAEKLNDKRLVGFINYKGEKITNAKYIDAGHFSEGIASASIYDSKNTVKWGFIDTSGQWLLEPIFDAVWSEFCNGVAIVKKGEYWGYVDTKGNWIVRNKLGEYGQDVIASTHMQYVNYVPCTCRFK